MNINYILNRINQVGGYLRRSARNFYDTVTIATGVTKYQVFNTSTGNSFLRNLQLPFQQQLFLLMDFNLLLKATVINTTALYTSLLELLQKSYFEIIIDARKVLKIPLAMILEFYYSDSIGTGAAITYSQTKKVKAGKRFFEPLLFNAQSNIVINLVVSSTAATDFNGKTILVKFNGILSDKLDPAFNFNNVDLGTMQSIDYTLYNTIAVSGTGQNTYNLFTDNTLADNLRSENLPLPYNARFELQNYEILFAGNNSDATELPNLIFDNRSQNYLSIKVNDVSYLNDTIEDALSIISNQPQTFNDNAGTPVATNAVTTSYWRQSKTLEIPIIFPASGLVNVQLTQPSSSLNNTQSFTVMFNGRLLRSKA